MDRRFDAGASRAVLALTFFLTLFCQMALGQEREGGVAEAVQEARIAGVPTETLNHLLTLGYQNQVDSRIMASLIHILAETKREDMPLGPFLNKIEEGFAKHVPHHLIQRVLEKKLDDYRFTRSVIEEQLRNRGEGQAPVPPEYLHRISEGLTCGITRGQLRGIIEGGPSPLSPPALALAVETAASLVQNRFDPEVAQEIASAGLRNQYFSPDSRDFARVLIVAKEKGTPLHKISSAAMDAIQKRLSVRDLASRLGVTSAEISRGPIIGRGSAETPMGRSSGKGEVGPRSDPGWSGPGTGPGGGPGAPGGGRPGGRGGARR